MNPPEDRARARQHDRIGGTISIVGAAVMSVVSVVLSRAVPIPGRDGTTILYGGLAVWVVVAICGFIVLKRGAEK